MSTTIPAGSRFLQHEHVPGTHSKTRSMSPKTKALTRTSRNEPDPQSQRPKTCQRLGAKHTGTLQLIFVWRIFLPIMCVFAWIFIYSYFRFIAWIQILTCSIYCTACSAEAWNHVRFWQRSQLRSKDPQHELQHCGIFKHRSKSSNSQSSRPVNLWPNIHQNPLKPARNLEVMFLWWKITLSNNLIPALSQQRGS